MKHCARKCPKILIFSHGNVLPIFPVCPKIFPPEKASKENLFEKTKKKKFHLTKSMSIKKEKKKHRKPQHISKAKHIATIISFEFIHFAMAHKNESERIFFFHFHGMHKTVFWMIRLAKWLFIALCVCNHNEYDNKKL